MENKDESVTPASKRINQNKLYLLFSQPEVTRWVKRMRSLYGIPPDGFELPSKADIRHPKIQEIQGWILRTRKDGRVDELNEKINVLLQEHKLGREFRDPIAIYLKYNFIHGLARRNVRVVHKKEKPNSVFVEFLGSISKREMLSLWSEINATMDALSDGAWSKAKNEKLDLAQAFIDRQTYERRRRYAVLVEQDDNTSDEDIRRRAAAKKKSIQRLNKRAVKKK